VLVAALGIEPDVPGGTLAVNPAESVPWDKLELDGLLVGGERLSVRWEGGEATVVRGQ
jgi:hypothetical protein